MLEFEILQELEPNAEILEIIILYVMEENKLITQNEF